MKKLTLCLVLVLVLALAGCGHTHTGEAWEMNGREHWKTCECGEKFDAAEHAVDDSGLCADCGAEVFAWDEGIDLYRYDEQGNLVCYQTYDLLGNLLTDERIEYTYDANGEIGTEKRYSYDVLTEESVYENGEILSVTSYYEDGTRNVCEYDENGNLVTMFYYDADGTILSREESEYALDSEGEWYEVSTVSVDAEGIKYVSIYIENGDQVGWVVIDADGTVMRMENYDFVYDEEGRKLNKKIYSFDVLTQELIYTLVEFEDGWMNYPGTIIDYHEDGTKTVTVYDENDEIVSQTHYDAEGNEIG